MDFAKEIMKSSTEVQIKILQVSIVKNLMGTLNMYVKKKPPNFQYLKRKHKRKEEGRKEGRKEGKREGGKEGLKSYF